MPTEKKRESREKRDKKDYSRHSITPKKIPDPPVPNRAHTEMKRDEKKKEFEKSKN